MRNIAYILGIGGFVCLVLSLASKATHQTNYLLYFWLGVVLLGICIPVSLWGSYLRKKKIASQLNKYPKKKNPSKITRTKTKTSKTFPTFHEQKSGLTWGGGNMHGSIAKRGTKKRFLNK